MEKKNYRETEIIKEELNKELIGQEVFINDIVDYFNERIENGVKGTAFILGQKDTGKRTAIKLLFEKFHRFNLLKGARAEEINLRNYNFKLGYNSFLTDLYKALNSDSEVVIFRNFDEASDEMMSILSNIYPDSCLALNENYVIKNDFLIEADEDNKDEEVIKNFICHSKFFVFLSYKEEIEVTSMFTDSFIKHIDKIFYTKPLNKAERTELIRRNLMESFKKIEEQFKINIRITLDKRNTIEKDSEFCEYLQESYKEDKAFGITEFLSYKIEKPLISLINKEGLKAKETLVIYLSKDKIYCRNKDENFDLEDYLVPTIDEVKYKLNSIIGMKDLKDFINTIENNIKVQRIRERLGFKTSSSSMNMIFVGNAGTGKTNAARVTYEYLNALGLLRKGTFKEVSKADFVSENSMDTARRTNEIIESAIGGVLFIDEAYSLCESKDDKVGKEIVDALLKGIEDNREDLVVIMAGYENDMENFLSMNSGLKSRFPNKIVFEDYNPEEMYEIAINIAKSKGYRIADEVKNNLVDLFSRNQIKGKNDLGNARFVRNVIENAIMDASKKYLSDSHKKIDLLENDNFNFKTNAKFNLQEELEKIIGLESVKKLIKSQYKLVVAQEKRRAAGIELNIEQNLNMVFAGNPGTGKTSIARLVAEMFSSMGMLKTGQLIETDRSSFVSEVPGETSRKTEEKFKEALGGVLFIDEAYTLASDDLGKEAIETLLKLIEDNRGEVIVILAGYEKDMEDFFDVNIGLKSRFPLWTIFEDYKPNELLMMAVKLIVAKGFRLSENGLIALEKSFINIYENSDATSGNGRMVRNYVENLIRTQSIRIAENDISIYEMDLITSKDVEKVNKSTYDNNFDLEELLKDYIGRESVKEFLRNQYKQIKLKEKRNKFGLKIDSTKTMNLVFQGKIGTGKRKALNILSEMYFSLGILRTKDIVEIDKSEIDASIECGNTFEQILNKSIGKILFIDKAVKLLDSEDNTGLLGTLIKFIDKNKNKIVIILADEDEKLREVILNNPSINYRFPEWINFEDYSVEELSEMAIELLKAKSADISLVEDILRKSIKELSENKYLSLRNGLMIKNYLERIINIQTVRVYDEEVALEKINVIEESDIIKAKKQFLNTLLF
ncbi:MAG: AAA family ATPase [Sarcina sp.]